MFIFLGAKGDSVQKRWRNLSPIFGNTQAVISPSTVKNFVNWYLPKMTITRKEFSPSLIRTRIIGFASTSTPSSWPNYLLTTKTEWLSFFLRSSIQTVRTCALDWGGGARGVAAKHCRPPPRHSGVSAARKLHHDFVKSRGNTQVRSLYIVGSRLYSLHYKRLLSNGNMVYRKLDGGS